MQIVMAYLKLFWRNPLFEMRVAAGNRRKFTKTPYFGDSRSFKVIDIDIPKKLVASACYVKQHMCAFHAKRANNGRITPI